ncbi:MAG: NAD(P)-dependent oxidoreductase [Desulfobacterium sp.]
MKTTRVGFVGLGVMGIPMAANLCNAGYEVNIYDIDMAAADRALQEMKTGSVMATPKAVAQASDVVITMLPSGKYVNAVTTGPDGLLEGFQGGEILIDTSSSEPWITMELSKRLSKQGVEMIDAPVSGAQIGAQNAELIFMVGGKEEAISKVTPILKAMGKQLFHLGPVGSGHMMKCINNLITSMTFMATAEGLVIGKKYGIDPSVMTDVLNASTGMSWVSQTHIKQRIINRKFDDAFKLNLMIKDIGIAMNLADKSGLSVPISALGHQLWKAAGHSSEKEGSISNMVRWIEDLSNIEISPVESI